MVQLLPAKKVSVYHKFIVKNLKVETLIIDFWQTKILLLVIAALMCSPSNNDSNSIKV